MNLMRKNRIFLLLWISFLFSCKVETYQQGMRLYEINCADCHGKHGEGLKSLYPPLANSDYLKANLANVPCIIKNGLEESINVNNKIYKEKMFPIEHLNDVEMTNIINYILHEFNNAPIINNAFVKESLENCPKK